MVVFGLFSKQRTSNMAHSCPAEINGYKVCDESKDISRDILDELMAIDTNTIKGINDLNTTSLNLDNIIKNVSAINNIDYKDALLNSLYSQVEYLRQESLSKNEMIKSLINNSFNCSCSHVKNVNTKCEKSNSTST